MPCASIEDARSLAERIRTVVETHEFREAETARSLCVTVSVGVAARSNHESPQALLEAADRALYRAKLGGRYRVAFGS
jgi:diguanylate cyclase (GGDEF)-like protein